MKKLFYILFCIILAIFTYICYLLIAATFSYMVDDNLIWSHPTTINGIRYEVYEYRNENNNKACVVKYDKEKYAGDITIPSSIDYQGTFPVTCIGDEAFKDCTELTSISLPSSITDIGWLAFIGCSNLRYDQKIELYFWSLTPELIFIIALLSIIILLLFKRKTTNTSMGFVDTIRVCMKEKYASLEGRATRSEFWYFMLFYFLAIVGVATVGGIIIGTIAVLLSEYDDDMMIVFGSFGFLIVFGIARLGFICPAISVLVRRLHDTGRSGWKFWLRLIPIVGHFIIFIFALLPSKEQDNKYGPYIRN